MKDYVPRRQTGKSERLTVKKGGASTSDLPPILRYFFALAFLLLLLKLVFHLPAYLSLTPNKINIHGTQILSEADVRHSLNLSKEQSWISLDPYELSLQLRNHPWIEKAMVHRSPPQTIDVHVTERVPMAFLKTANNLFLFGRDFRVLKRLELNGSWDLPIIVNRKLTNVVPGDRLHPRDLKRAFQLIELLKTDKTLPLDAVSEVIITDPFNIVLIAGPDGMRIKFGFENFERKLAALSRLMPQISENKKRIKYIDLRSIRGATVKFR